MKQKEILVFGASGFIGSHLIRKLTKKNYRVTAVTRNIHMQKGLRLKSQGNFGYINLIEANIFDINKLNEIIGSANICINLVGILYESKKNTFLNIHSNFPNVISQIAKEKNVDQFIHISALGIEESSGTSKYAKSKLEGEKLISKNFPNATILRPSVVFGSEDSFTNLFMSLLSKFPIFPLYYKGQTKFQPIHVNDLCDLIFNIVDQKIESKTIECVGPDIISFKDIIQRLMNSIKKKRILISLPLFFGKIIAKFMEIFMSKPILTLDQLKLLSYNSIASNKYENNFDLNMKPKGKFDIEIEKYSYRFRDDGEYSREKVTK